MKLLNFFPLLIAGSLLAACGETTADTELSPDPEFGLETLDGKADSFAIRPGSPEAEAVVNYVNLPLADDAAGTAFRNEIDTKLYSRAAANIAKYRAGADGSFGTQDDQLFANLTAVDKIPYVGRTALMKLFELAEAAGYFQRASLDCADYVDHDRYNNYRINSYADLLEYENSHCTTVNGNLYLQISGTDLLPPAARAIHNLRHLRTINGNLQITTSNLFNSVHFESLETVTGTLRAESPVGRKHTLEFTALTSATSITLTAIDKALFPALEHNDEIALTDSDLEGFTALKTAGNLMIVERSNGVFNVDFPALTEVESLELSAVRHSSYTAPDVTFTGGFDSLATGDALSMNEGKYAALELGALTTLGTLNTTRAVDPYLGLSALTEVSGYYSNLDEFATGVHAGPAKLETVGTMTITSGVPVNGYAALTTAQNNITITTNRGVEGFNALSTVGGSISLNVGRDYSQIPLSGFNSLTYLNSLSIAANNAPVVVGPLFEKLENTDGGVSLIDNGGFVDNPVFAALIAIGGGLRVDTLIEGSDMMPVLEIVDGNVAINYTPQELVGFPKLERIEGSLTLKGSVNKMTGMAALTAIGGNLSVARSLSGAELDAFLNRLTEFSGTIHYN